MVLRSPGAYQLECLLQVGAYNQGRRKLPIIGGKGGAIILSGQIME